MDILHAVILGVIEGITEFLPVSSTGHLIVAGNWMDIGRSNINDAFKVIIQFSAIMAVLSLYRDKFSFKHMALWGKVALSFLPIGLVGFLFHAQIKSLFTVSTVGVMFIIGGVVFLVLESFYREEKARVKSLEQITYRQAFWIGLAQIFALIPGTSRAGASIVGAMLVGVNRKTSAEFSFLLALPVLGAAAGFDLLKHYKAFTGSDFLALFVGFVTSFLVAYVTIKLFLRFLQKFTFVGFGIYRIILGIILLWML